MPNIITLNVNSTHFFLISCSTGWLLLDAGWGMGPFTAQLKAYKIPFSEIRWVMFTHHHPDHAGLVQAVREQSGARLIIQQVQIPYLSELHAFQAKKGDFQPIQVGRKDLVSPDSAALRALGIPGQIVETPGHSPDSISLVLESGEAFIGDLHLPEYEGSEHQAETLASWRKLAAAGAKRIYPAHHDPFSIDRVNL